MESIKIYIHIYRYEVVNSQRIREKNYGNVLLELFDPGEHLQVFVTAQVHVVFMGVPGVEGMKADHVHALMTTNHE